MTTTPLYEKILIAADGSEKNMAAVSETIRIARACGAEVVAVYVQDLGALESIPTGEMMLKDTWSVIQKESESTMSRIRSMAEGVAMTTAVLEGKPAPRENAGWNGCCWGAWRNRSSVQHPARCLS